MTLLNINVKW